MTRSTWHRPDGKGFPQGLKQLDYIEVVYEDGESVRGEARDFVWNWGNWDEDQILEYRVLDTART